MRKIWKSFCCRSMGCKKLRIADVDSKDLWACVVEDTPDRLRAKPEEYELEALLKQENGHYTNVAEMRKTKQRLEFDEFALYSEEDRYLEMDEIKKLTS